MVTTTARNAYMDASVATASPARLLVMLLERLVLDVRRARDAQGVADHATAHQQLVHAQDIVMELRSSLKPDMFVGGQELAALYDYLHARLVRANVQRDADITAHCLELSEDLCATWREAAMHAAAPGAHLASA